MQNSSFIRNVGRYGLASIFLLLIPLVGKWDWTALDFIMAGILLIGTGFIFELVKLRISSKRHRIIAGVIIGMLLILTWAELAVGIFGTPFAGN